MTGINFKTGTSINFGVNNGSVSMQPSLGQGKQGIQGPAGEKGDTGAAGGSDASFAAWITNPASATAAALNAAYAPLPPGTPDATKFYRGDGTWAVPAVVTEAY